MLARGLVELDRGTPDATGLPYPRSLHTAWNRLGRLMLRQGLPVPPSLPALLQQCEEPLPWLALSLPDGAWLPGDSLLHQRQVTDACVEIADSAGDLEQQESLMRGVLIFCQSHGSDLQPSYQRFRTLLVQRPVMTAEDLLDTTLHPLLQPLSTFLKQAYQEVPLSCLHDGQVYICRHCGWTLTWHKGEPRCGSQQCPGGQDPRRARLAPAPRETLRRLLPGLYRFVTLPGLAEVGFYEKVRQSLPRVDLYPDFDRWDLRLHFADGQSWALDFKDWGRPFWLASELQEKRREAGDARAIVVIPDRRVREYPGYLNILRHLVPADGGLEFRSVRQLQREINAKVGGE